MNENILLKTPYLKKNTYISELDKEVVLKLTNINIKNILKYRDYYIIELYLNNIDNINDLTHIDENILNIYSKKNKKWFDNELSKNELNELFLKSYCTHTCTTDIILNNDTIIIKNNKIVDLNNYIITELKNNDIEIEIEQKILGIYISKKSIKIKWIISKIYIDTIVNDMELNKEELENEWIDTFNETVEFLENKKIEYTKRMNNIEVFKKNNSELLNEIKNINNKKSWNQKINILKNNIKNILSINDNR
jgi:hypothetical protein